MASEVSPKVLSYVEETIGATIIGFTLATALYGISFLQIYLYFRAYWNDHKGFKITVVVLGVFDTLATILSAHALYTLAVIHFNDPMANMNLPWSFAGQAIAIDFGTIIAQGFYAHQIWLVSKNIWVVAVVAVCSFLGFTGDFSLNILAYVSNVTLSSQTFLIVGSITPSFLVLCDITITATLSWYLRSFRSLGREDHSNKLIDKIVIYTVSRGTITAVAQTFFLAIYVAWPSKTYWIPFQLVLGKLYINSVLATLNIRRNLFAPDHSERNLRLNTDLDTKNMALDTGSNSPVEKA
jgi:hypothetical protein